MGFSTDKKLPHAALSGCNQLRKACNLIGIHQMASLEHTFDKQAYYSFIDPGRMTGWKDIKYLTLAKCTFTHVLDLLVSGSLQMFGNNVVDDGDVISSDLS